VNINGKFIKRIDINGFIKLIHEIACKLSSLLLFAAK
jgi:hypothetical protein